jgi:hypothetical protein
MLSGGEAVWDETVDLALPWVFVACPLELPTSVLVALAVVRREPRGVAVARSIMWVDCRLRLHL